MDFLSGLNGVLGQVGQILGAAGPVVTSVVDALSQKPATPMPTQVTVPVGVSLLSPGQRTPGTHVGTAGAASSSGGMGMLLLAGAAILLLTRK